MPDQPDDPEEHDGTDNDGDERHGGGRFEPDDPEEHGGTDDDGDERHGGSHLAKDEEVNQPDDAEAEEEGVGLEVADLEEAQDEAAAPRCAA